MDGTIIAIIFIGCFVFIAYSGSKLFRNASPTKNTDCKTNYKSIEKIWIIIFLLVTCFIVYIPPYHTVMHNRDMSMDTFAGYGTINKFPNGLSNRIERFTSIDYKLLGLHELLAVSLCGIGYIITGMIKKK